MTAGSFKSESNYAGIPYRVLSDASVEALMPGGEVINFKTVEQFVTSANGAPNKTDNMRLDVPLIAERKKTQNLPASAEPLDYYSLLLDTIERTKNNSAQLRELVYERMRFNFKRDLLFGHSTLGLADIVRHVNDFELAVKRIEANAGNSSEPRRQVDNVSEQTKQHEQADRASERSEQREQLDRASARAEQQEQLDRVGEHLEQGDQTDVDIEPAPVPVTGDITVYTPPTPVPPLRVTADSIGDSYVLRRPKKFAVYRLVGFSAVGIVVVAALVTIATRFSHEPASQVDIANETAKISAVIKEEIANQQKQKELPFPVPTSYGIYALSNNQLTALESLPISVPDPRVMLSAEITKPSGATLNDARPAFILFRRDFLNNAPQSLALRVVARVKRETKIVDGKATVREVEGTWRIRNVLHELKVSPVPGQPEMIMAQAPNDAPLPAGRYALVLNRAGYDFMVAGQTESPESCLEGFEGANGSIFTQCKAP
jgi:hypothetical protein